MANDSPDLTPYRDLRIYDRDPQEVFEVALQDLQTRLPGWVPREDNTEVLLMEAFALEVAEAIFAINRLPGAIMTILMGLYGITRDEGAAPTVTVTVTAVDSFGYVIPPNTRFMLNLAGGYDPVVFTNTSAVLILNGDTSVTFAVIGNRYTNEANSVPSTTTLEVLDSVSFVEGAALATEVTGGRSAETDQEWSTRGVQRLKRLVDTLAVPSHFTSAALENAAVNRATTIDLYNPDAGSGVPGDHPGHVTVAVYGSGAVLSTPEKTTMETDFSTRALANLTIHVVDPTITSVGVTVTVQRLSTYTNVAVKEAVEAALSVYLSPDTWPWAGMVRRNELIALISNVPGVDYVTTLAAPASDTALSGVAPLADAGTLTVTVTS